MNTLDINRNRMLVRVTQFGAEHRDRFPAAGPAGRLFAAISTAVDQLGAHATAESSGDAAARDGALSKAAAREALRQALDTIARTARAFDVGTPGLGGRFRLPSVRNDHELTTAACSFSMDAAPLKARFLTHGLPKTFIADLKAAVVAFDRTSQDRFAACALRAAARAGIHTAISSALVALNRLDALVLNAFRDEPVRVAAWASAKHVTRVRTRGRRTPIPSLPSAAAGRTPAARATAAGSDSLTTDAGTSA